MKESATHISYEEQLEELRSRLQEANDVIEAIRSGSVDALIVQGADGHQLYTLKTADQTYRVFIEKMNEGAVTINRDGLILYGNSSFADLMQLSLGKVIGSPFSELVAADSEILYTSLISEGWKAESRGEISLKRNDGQLLPILLSLSTLELDEGIALSLIVTDLSEQKKVQEELRQKNEELEKAQLIMAKLNAELEHKVQQRTKKIREEEEKARLVNQRLEIALDAGKLGSYEMDLATGRMDCTEQCKANYGLPPDTDFTFEKLMEMILPSFREKVKQAVDEACRNGTVYSEEYQVEWPDHSIHWIKASGKIRDAQPGGSTKIVGVTFDITDHKELQQQKDDFIGIASHELKTPVTSIKAYTQLLERILLQKGDLQEAAMVAKMDNQVNRLTNLIGDLLDVTKINSGKLQFNERPFTINALTKEVVEELQRTADRHHIIEDLGPEATVYADAERIGQVITNLVTNAIKYSPNANKIIVHTSLVDDTVMFCVEDFGIGISDEKKEKVFEQFYRVSGDMQHTFPGLGLGLFIAAKIVQRAGGRIWVESKEGEGATFCFTLPLYNVTDL